MTIILPALAVGFAAFCVWLGARIFNRRERWAKWTAVALVTLPVLYVASIGPVLYVIAKVPDPERAIETVWPAYRPVGSIAVHSHHFWVVIRWYVNLWVEFPDFLD